MQRIFLLSKLHHARVTQADLEYEGSFGIDEEILQAANILPNEQVNIYNVDNGARFTTYAIVAARGSRIMQANGACAHKVKVGDRVIICTYGALAAAEIKNHTPRVLFMNAENDFEIKNSAPVTKLNVAKNYSS